LNWIDILSIHFDRLHKLDSVTIESTEYGKHMKLWVFGSLLFQSNRFKVQLRLEAQHEVIITLCFVTQNKVKQEIGFLFLNVIVTFCMDKEEKFDACIKERMS
jgi:hypothetical protein